jgi:hypothetical protein
VVGTWYDPPTDVSVVIAYQRSTHNIPCQRPDTSGKCPVLHQVCLEPARPVLQNAAAQDLIHTAAHSSTQAACKAARSDTRSYVIIHFISLPSITIVVFANMFRLSQCAIAHHADTALQWVFVDLYRICRTCYWIDKV